MVQSPPQAGVSPQNFGSQPSAHVEQPFTTPMPMKTPYPHSNQTALNQELQQAVESIMNLRNEIE